MQVNTILTIKYKLKYKPFDKEVCFFYCVEPVESMENLFKTGQEIIDNYQYALIFLN